ncbi:MAG: metallophosphoesterase [Ruminococcus sp.]|nr:metallophosphoesterase [Ruminococcus sp.]
MLTIASFLILWLCIDLIISNCVITVSRHSLESDKITEPVRLVVVADTHSKEFGSDNERLIKKISEQEPDLILTVGDLIDRDDATDEHTEYLCSFISELCNIAPVYSCLGNQERSNEDRAALEGAMIAGGATLLELEYQDIIVNGNSLRIGGLSYYRQWDEESGAYLQEYISADEESFTLMLCHHPEFYLWGIEDYPLDLMVSGHTHGGMIRLPFVGALYAPEQGNFPEYAGGFYEMELGHLAVCKGLGSSPEYIPRFHNPPELMVIDLI